MEFVEEKVNITALLQGILNAYPGNSAVFREFIQNSDDAGAKKQAFVLDERNYPTDSLCDQSLLAAQGPSLLAFNDGELSKKDWEALTTIHSSSKKADETQTGKNGLGFRASYHFTENPQVLSGGILMVLDPHRRLKDRNAGLKIPITETKYSDQFMPFDQVREIFGDLNNAPSTGFYGTIFRLPLRTENQARESKIKSRSTPPEEVRNLLNNFCRDELAEVILFLKHITEVEVQHIDVSGVRTLIGKVSMEKGNSTHSVEDGYILSTACQMTDGAVKKRDWYCRDFNIETDEAARILSNRLGYDVGTSLIEDKLSPSISLAAPMDEEPIIGYLFTLLPLPIKTHFPVHLNAVFAITPDRQSLKNIEEVGDVQSRERRLVEWNRVIFEVWTPVAWAVLIEELTYQRRNWSIWPTEEHGAYWMNMTTQVVQEVIRRRSRVFPTIRGEGSALDASFITLEDPHTLLAPPTAAVDLGLFAELGFKVVQPPQHIFSVLTSHEVSIAARELSPSMLHDLLKAKYQQGVDPRPKKQTIERIIDYLVFSTFHPTICNIEGLPWFSHFDGTTVTLQYSGVGETVIIPASEEEARLFASHPRMLAWSSSTEKLRTTLLKSSNALNVAPLCALDVFQILTVRYTTSVGDVAWVLEVLSWLVGHQAIQRQLFNNVKISSLFLLPSTTGLRRLSEKAIFMTDTSTSGAWESLGVPCLQNDLPAHVIALLTTYHFVETQESNEFLSYVLDHADPTLQHRLTIKDFEALRKSIQLSLFRRQSFQHFLPKHQQKIMEQLSVFSVRSTSDDKSLSPVRGNRLHVNVGDDFPLPIQAIIYVDVRDPITRTFIQLIESLDEKRAWDILKIAIEHWDDQPADLQDRFVGQMFDHDWMNIPHSILERLRRLPFVSVQGTNSRVPPVDLIHPRSPLAPLYEGEVGRIPCDQFATKQYLNVMAFHGFLHSSLHAEIVQERLAYLSENSSVDIKAFEKSVAFVQLLNRYWEESFSKHIHFHRDRPWMPRTKPSLLVSPNGSRDLHIGDHAHPKFYDFELNIFNKDEVFITEPQFRKALGWSERVPPHVLVEQFRKTISLPQDKDRYQRLKILMKYMSGLLETGDFSSEALELAREAVLNRSWIPVHASSIETVETEYALLSNINLYPPFHLVYSAGYKSFLLAMGCSQERPHLHSITNELRKHETFLESDLPSILALLEEIPKYDSSFDHPPLIPAQNGRAYPIHDMFYPDSDFLLPPDVQNKFPTHDRISRALADRLGIQLISSLGIELGDSDSEDDEDDVQMAVDLVDRIRGFLKEYDIQYALNEFLANANDAGARKFSIMLDCRKLSFPMAGIISSAFHELTNQASIVLFNDAKLTRGDFRGLRNVGRGGKLDNKDTHGRHGLGALSFYYFTDVATVISGHKVMILDPSGSYLPRKKNGVLRTSLVRKISKINKQYPNHLCPYDSLYGFSKESDFYDGTLFCLPLNTKIAAEQCDEGRALSLLDTRYREIAKNAFFFTRLDEIRADSFLNSMDNPSTIWSFLATRTEPSSLPNIGSSYHFLEVKEENTKFSKWVIATSSGNRIPPVHEATATGLNLALSNLVAQLAMKLEPKMGLVPSSLFSTLRLPRTTSFPFHIDARFAISSNRQSVVFETSKDRTARDPKSDYNAWILTSVVPPLYLDTLALLVNDRIITRRSYWLRQLLGVDEIYKLTAEAFHAHLTSSETLLFKSINGKILSFKNSIFSNHHAKEVVEVLVALDAHNLVEGYESSGLTTLETAKTTDAPYARSIIANTSLAKIQDLYSKEIIQRDHLLEVLKYIREEPNLAGLPLLISSSSNPVSIPGKVDRRVYLSEIPEHARLFDTALFIDPAFLHSDLSEIWASDNINVFHLKAGDLNELIRAQLNSRGHSGKEVWLKDFWSFYRSLPGPPSLTVLEQGHIKLVRGDLSHHSLHECRPLNVIYFANNDDRQNLGPSLLRLGIDVITPIKNSILRHYLVGKFPDLLGNILGCLSKRSIHDFSALPPEEQRSLTTWLVSSLDQNGLDRISDRFHLEQLKIWSAYTCRGKDFYSVSELQILPPKLPIEDVAAYLQHQPIAGYSTILRNVITFCRYGGMTKKKRNKVTVTMSPDSILNSIEIPSLVNLPSELESFKVFLGSLFDSFRYSELRSTPLRVFDTMGRLRPLTELYDHIVPLFSASLTFTSKPFVHPTLHNLLQDLRGFGLKSRISFDTFFVCASAIQISLEGYNSNQDGSPTLDDLMNMSRVAFQCYSDILPQQVMRNDSEWADLDVIKFVRPKDVHRQGASYLADDFYAGERGVLLAPNRLVLPSFEPIAWTQRALFFDNPSDALIALNSKLGVPKVWEVVAHLEVLTTKIAPGHPGNSTLLSDITATYKWLNDHAEEARVYMLHLDGEKLFLNVDDPNEDWWVGSWATAKEMVLNLQYDYGDLKRVKSFLCNYHSLLLASGCNMMSLFSMERKEMATDLASRSDQTDIRRVFNEMRKAGEVVDMVLVPTFASADDVLASLESEKKELESSDHEPQDLGSEACMEEEEMWTEDTAEDIDPELRAHRVVLAATIPFIRDWADLGWKHNKLGELALVDFNGTSFGAKCVLDFIYTGDFMYDPPKMDDFERIKTLLYELLALLTIAEEWDFPDLKGRVEHHIVYKNDLIQHLFPLHDEIVRVADRYNATSLKEDMKRFEESNKQLMMQLKKSTQHSGEM